MVKIIIFLFIIYTKQTKGRQNKMNLNIQKAKETLNKYNISGTDFAARFGIHRSYVYNAMNGNATPGRKFFAAWAKFCRLFGLNFLDYIEFDDEDSDEENTSN